LSLELANSNFSLILLGLASALSLNNNIDTLNCSSMGMKSKGVCMILDRLSSNLRNLIIDENFDGPDRIELGKALSAVLSKPSLTSLSISGKTTPLGDTLIPLFSMLLLLLIIISYFIFMTFRGN
jgi:hypothetical protein